MTFLNPIFLWAAFAIAIPIIVHLFNFRRPKKVLFSDISFVKEVRKSIVKKLKLRQWLLLASRILAILCLVALFAQPVLKSSTGATARLGNSSVAVVIDNSYSMKGGNDKGAYWMQANELAKEIINGYSRNDEFLVMTSDEPRLHFNFADQQGAIQELKTFSFFQNTNSLADLLGFTNEIFANAANRNRAIYFISDFQKSTVLPDSILNFTAPEGTEVKLVPLTTRRLRNAYIKDHEVISKIIEPGKPIYLKLKLVNDSPEPQKNLNLRVMLGKEERPLATEDLEPFEEKIVETNIVVQETGWQSGYFVIDDNPIDFDNRRYFSFYIPHREKMLIVEEEPIPNVKMMFGEDVLNQFEVKMISHRDLAAEDLTVYKSIMLAGLSELSTGMQEKLNAHIEAGKSLLIFPGEKMKANEFNTFLNNLKIGTFGEARSFETGIKAGAVDLDHPVFDGVFIRDPRNKQFDAPVIFKDFIFKPSGSLEQNTIMTTNDHSPAIVETKMPMGGLVYIFSFLPNKSWTDFTLKSSGLAMIVQIARMMNQAQKQNPSEVLGASGTKSVETASRDIIRMVGENENEIIPEQFVRSGAVVLSFAQQKLTEGNYDLIQNDQLIGKISFNAPDVESRLEGRSEQDLKDYIASQNIKGIEVSGAVRGEFADEIRQQTEGVPLWKYFLIAEILFFLAEFVIIRWNFKPALAQ